jgi:hypothetical protein
VFGSRARFDDLRRRIGYLDPRTAAGVRRYEQARPGDVAAARCSARGQAVTDRSATIGRLTSGDIVAPPALHAALLELTRLR